jgi:uncharacterized protein (TIGR02099 family)
VTTDRRRTGREGVLTGVLAGLRWAVGSTLVLAAVVLTGMRLALPQLDHHPDQVAAVASRALGYPVQFARLTTTMSGVTPQLELREATLTGADGSITRVGTLRLWFDWTASLLARAPRLSALEVDGLQIAVLRQPDGRWRIAGMSASNNDDQGGFSTWLLAQPQVRLRAAVIDIADSAVPARVLRLEPADVELQRRGDRHWLDVRSGVAGAASGSFRLLAWIEHLQTDPAVAESEAYVTARNLTGADVPIGGLLFGGQLNGEAWVRWKAGRVERLHGSLDGQVQVRTAVGDEVVDFDTVQLSGVAERAGDDWAAGIDRLRAEAGERSWRIERGFLRRRADGVVASAQSVDLAGLGPLLGLLAANDERLARLAGTDPTLRARQVAATLDAAASIESLGLAAQVDELSWQADGTLPGLAGLAGELRIGASAASFELQGEPHLTLTAPHIYAAPRQLDVARGVITAQWSAAGVQAQVQDFATRSGSIDLAARARLSLPADGEPDVFVQASTPQAPAAEFFTLLPDASLSPTFIAWGHDAIKAGTLVNVQALLRGDPRRFPFRDHQGAFVATTDFVDVALDYQPGAGWPEVIEGRGRFGLDGTQFWLTVDDGRLLDSRARNVDVRIPDIGLQSKRLLLQGVASGPAQDVIRFIQQSPLAQRFGRQVERLTFDRNADTDVALDLVFTGPDKSTRVSGTTHLRGNTLSIDGTGLIVAALRGDVGFGGGGLDARAVKAQLFGGPVTFDLRSAPGRPLRIEPRGEAAAADLVRYLRLPWPELFAGPLPWQGGIDIAGDGALDLDLKLDLDRATGDLPPPLDALHRQPMAVRAHCDCGGARTWDVTLAAQDLTARLDLAPVAGGGTVLRRGDLAIGVETRLPSAGFNVHGRLPDLALAPWLAWLTTHFGGPGAGDLPPPRVDIYVDRLAYLGQTFPGTRLQVVHDDAWDVSVDAPGVAGSVTISGNGADQRVQLDLARLHLTRQPPGGKGAAEPGVNPAAIPVLGGRVGELRFDGENFGALDFTSTRRADGLDFDSLELRGDYGRISGRGSWRGSAASSESRLTASAEFSDFGAFLGHFGVRDLVRGGNGKLKADLAWPGSPGAFDFPALTGTVGGDLRKGTLPDVEPGVGRLFGILSLDSVIRRLSLDFRDVFGRGFAIDRMSGDLALAAGQAQLKNLRVRGPAANLTLNGSTSLKDRSLDVDVLAVPQVTSTLPLAGAIAAPPVGAAIYLGQKMLGGTLDKVAEQRYHVTGTWAEPKIDKR